MFDEVSTLKSRILPPSDTRSEEFKAYANGLWSGTDKLFRLVQWVITIAGLIVFAARAHAYSLALVILTLFLLACANGLALWVRLIESLRPSNGSHHWWEMPLFAIVAGVLLAYASYAVNSIATAVVGTQWR